MTYHSDPLKDFYASRVNPNRVTYLFLMTDGQNEEKPDEFKPLLRQWGAKYGKKSVYGFYVMLDECAKNGEIEGIIGSQEHLWSVKTSDVNINLIRVQSSAIFNAKNEKYVELPIYGNTRGVKFETHFANHSIYKVSKTSIENRKLRVYITFSGDVSHLPESSNESLAITMSGGGEFDFLVTETVDITCERKPERTLKISVQ
jgi:hypothetical protein